MTASTHVVLFCGTATTKGFDHAPLSMVEPVMVADDDAKAILGVHADFLRRNAEGRLSRRHHSASRPDRNTLWFLRGAGERGDEIHAGHGDTTLYRIAPIAQPGLNAGPVGLDDRHARRGTATTANPWETGYDRLRTTLDEARGDAGRVEVTVAGEQPRRWTLALGDHVAADGSILFGVNLTILPDGSIAGRPHETVGWRGGHTMPDGARLERFMVAGVATMVAWRNRRRDRMAGAARAGAADQPT